MMSRFEHLFHDLQRSITGYGVRVPLETMDIEKPGEFDGLSITINPLHDAQPRSYYLAHAFGSIIQWSTDFKEAQKVFQELRTSAERRQGGPGPVRRGAEGVSTLRANLFRACRLATRTDWSPRRHPALHRVLPCRHRGYDHLPSNRTRPSMARLLCAVEATGQEGRRVD